MTRRNFIKSASLGAALLPPAPPGMVKLQSPKGEEQNLSLAKVSVEIVQPKVTSAPTDGFGRVAIAIQDGYAMLSWDGGEPPFQVQRKLSPEAPWENVGPVTMKREAQCAINGIATQQAFFRIKRTALSVNAVWDGNKTLLSFNAPELA